MPCCAKSRARPDLPEDWRRAPHQGRDALVRRRIRRGAGASRAGRSRFSTWSETAISLSVSARMSACPRWPFRLSRFVGETRSASDADEWLARSEQIQHDRHGRVCARSPRGLSSCAETLPGPRPTPRRWSSWRATARDGAMVGARQYAQGFGGLASRLQKPRPCWAATGGRVSPRKKIRRFRSPQRHDIGRGGNRGGRIRQPPSPRSARSCVRRIRAHRAMRWLDAELHARGEILLKQNPTDRAPAEAVLLTAIAIGATAEDPELRTARRARPRQALRGATGRLADAHAVLGPRSKASRRRRSFRRSRRRGRCSRRSRKPMRSG